MRADRSFIADGKKHWFIRFWIRELKHWWLWGKSTVQIVLNDSVFDGCRRYLWVFPWKADWWICLLRWMTWPMKSFWRFWRAIAERKNIFVWKTVILLILKRIVWKSSDRWWMHCICHQRNLCRAGCSCRSTGHCIWTKCWSKAAVFIWKETVISESWSKILRRWRIQIMKYRKRFRIRCANIRQRGISGCVRLKVAVSAAFWPMIWVLARHFRWLRYFWHGNGRDKKAPLWLYVRLLLFITGKKNWHVLHLR